MFSPLWLSPTYSVGYRGRRNYPSPHHPPTLNIPHPVALIADAHEYNYYILLQTLDTSTVDAEVKTPPSTTITTISPVTGMVVEVGGGGGGDRRATAADRVLSISVSGVR